MSVINPAGFKNVIEWADVMTGSLGFFSDPTNGTDSNFQRLDDPTKWQDWAEGIFGGVDPLGQDAPDPRDYDNWREWADRLFATSNFSG